MASSSSSSSPNSNPYVTLDVQEEHSSPFPYPYPSHVSAPNFVTVKLSGRDKYQMWKTQMLCLMESHGMLVFILARSLGKEKVGNDYSQWRRSDALVRGWILGSLSEDTLRYVLIRLKGNADFSAKDVWDELQTIYAPVVLPELVVADEKDVGIEALHLYRATLGGDWSFVDSTLSSQRVTVIDEITRDGNTALHLAVRTTKNREFLEKMLGRMPDDTDLRDVRNSDGRTLLHVAASVGNTEAAGILVARDRELLLVEDNDGQTPLAIALSSMHSDMFRILLKMNSDGENDTLFSGTSGDKFLVIAISSKNFSLAYDLVKRYKTLHSPAVLMAIAQNFPCKLNTIFEIYLGTDIIRWIVTYTLRTIFHHRIYRWVPRCCSMVEKVFNIFYHVIYWIIILIPLILKVLVYPLISERVRTHDDAIGLLMVVCRLIRSQNDPNSEHRCYAGPILEATRQNAYEVVGRILLHFPNAILSTNEDGHNIMQHAVINRSEDVYNLLCNQQRNIYRTLKDSFGNNLLHLAARLAPENKLNRKSGAALQIQRELQWFKEVEGYLCPLNINQKNSFDETPQMVFTREHKDLVLEGEKWMKATAGSYTITAALIITIVFAAAITVPGGNKDTGIPVFTNCSAFTIFAILNAISLFTAVTSLLMFLSILTARFAEQDFLFKLPTKLIIGLATLFISTTAMILAFVATLYLVFGQNNVRILIPIALLTCLPVTSFVTLQFPLVIDFISTTYGRSIFCKKRESLFH